MSFEIHSVLAVGGDLPTEFPSLGKLMLFLVGISVFLVLNALFVAAEFALVKVRKSQLVEAQEKRPKRAALGLHPLAQLAVHLAAGQCRIPVPCPATRLP